MSDGAPGVPSDGTEPPEARPPGPLTFLFHSLPRAVAGTLVLIGVAINFANVVSRYLFGSAIFWAEEILIFLVIALVSAAIVAVTFNGDHLRMDLLLATAAERARRIVEGLIVLTFVACGGFVAVQAFEVVSAFRRTGTVSLTAGVPIAVPHSFLFIGFALMVVAIVLRSMLRFRGRVK